jgi:hypothetical protein
VKQTASASSICSRETPAAALVLLLPARSLHHSVHGDLRGGRQLHVMVPFRSM